MEELTFEQLNNTGKIEEVKVEDPFTVSSNEINVINSSEVAVSPDAFLMTPPLAPTKDYQVINKKYFEDNVSYQTMYFYPNADPEITSVDGVVYRDANESWATKIAGAGTGHNDNLSGAAIEGPKAQCTGVVGTPWATLWRSIFLFDTSDLPNDCTIVSAEFSFYCNSKENTFSYSAPWQLFLVGSAPASNTDLVAADFTTLGTTILGVDSLGSGIIYANVSTTDPNTFTLNAAGLAAISKTGITKLGLRMGYDGIISATPGWEDAKLCRYYLNYADDTDKQRIPKLKVIFK